MQRKQGRRRERKGGGRDFWLLWNTQRKVGISWKDEIEEEMAAEKARKDYMIIKSWRVLLKALNSLSGLFLPTHKASSGPEEATWQSFSEAALHPATLTDKSKGSSFLGSAVCILKRVLWSQTSFFSGNLVLTSLREEFPRRTSSYAPTKKTKKTFTTQQSSET